MGYKLRKHIGKALEGRSQAVRNTLDKYNAAARALSPPRPKLSGSADLGGSVYWANPPYVNSPCTNTEHRE
ncbi:hypothetical protein C0993_001309 [Termitomyces sp. T159_Od127]|nr:hypothetical protein C0993_001309 [Termitomyces sp. T159_Od127]